MPKGSEPGTLIMSFTKMTHHSANVPKITLQSPSLTALFHSKAVSTAGSCGGHVAVLSTLSVLLLLQSFPVSLSFMFKFSVLRL